MRGSCPEIPAYGNGQDEADASLAYAELGHKGAKSISRSVVLNKRPPDGVPRLSNEFAPRDQDQRKNDRGGSRRRPRGKSRKPDDWDHGKGSARGHEPGFAGFVHNLYAHNSGDFLDVFCGGEQPDVEWGGPKGEQEERRNGGDERIPDTSKDSHTNQVLLTQASIGFRKERF